MLKVRLQGTVKDIQWFGKLLEQHPKIRVLGVSKPFANKGTNKYFRVYAEIEKRRKYHAVKHDRRKAGRKYV